MNEGLDEAVQKYVSSVEADAKILPFDITGTEAHVLMLYQTKIISEADAVAILAALDRLRTGGTNLDSTKNVEDGHEVLEAYISKEAGKEAGGKTHTGRSRNDQVALATRMKLRQDARVIQESILQLASALLKLAEENVKTTVPLYTHLQHAQAGVLSHYFIAHADTLLRDYGRFEDMCSRLDASPLGAGPAGGSCLPIDRDVTAETLGFTQIVENALDATSSRDYIAEFVSCAAIMMVNLSRMSEDLVLWSSDEFAFVELADKSSSPSSAMPQKKNPDVLELTRGKAARVIGNLAAVLAIQKGLATGYGRDLQETKEPAWSSADISVGALRVIRVVITSMKINKNRMAEAAESGYLTALDVVEKMVAQKIPFRQAHLEVGSLVAAAHAAGKPLTGLDGAEIKRACTLDPEKVTKAISQCTTERSAQMRTTRGGTAASEQRRMIAKLKKEVGRLSQESTSRKKTSSMEADKMRDSIRNLLDRSRRKSD